MAINESTFNGVSQDEQAFYGGGSKQSGMADRPSPIMNSYGELQKSLSRLGESIDELRHRLQPALGDSRPTAETADGNAKHPNESPLSMTLRNEAARVEDYVRLVNDLNARLEL